MKILQMLILTTLAGSPASFAQAQAAKTTAPSAAPEALKDQASKLAYAIGLNLGSSLSRDGVTVDAEVVAQGVRDGQTGATPKLTQDEIKAVMTQTQADVQAHRQAKLEAVAESNQAEGAAFLATNKAKPGVTTLPSGLQYEVLKAGTGPTPKADDTVSCQYRGTLLNGTEFDSSYKRNEPLTIAVSGVIKGWTEALQHMPVGSKWRLYIPSDLAYGAKGAGADIGPNATLIFDVELLSIQPKS